MSAHNGTVRETEDGEKLRIRTGKSSWYKSNMRTSGRSDSAERSNKRKDSTGHWTWQFKAHT